MRLCGLARAVGVESHFNRYFGHCVIVCGSPFCPVRELLIDGGHAIIHACGAVDFAGCRSAGHSFGGKTTSAYNSEALLRGGCGLARLRRPACSHPEWPGHSRSCIPFVMRNANPLGSRSLSIVLVSPSLRNRVLGRASKCPRKARRSRARFFEP